MEHQPVPRGRGTPLNEASRYTRQRIEREAEFRENRPATVFHTEKAGRILSPNQSPDLDFAFGLNPYRGCEHGCSYCYARAYHEFLGMSGGLDFETNIVIKENAPERLREELGKWKESAGLISLSGVTDPYQPVEKERELTRRCLKVLAEFRQGVVIITKNALVTRDLDILRELAGVGAVAVYLSVTTLDPGLARRLEPRASSPRQRLEAMARLVEAGIPAGPSIAPVIPGLNDEEIPAIIDAAAQAGAGFATWGMLRLPGQVEGIFSDWLDREEPGRKEKVLNRIRSAREGRLNQPSGPGRMHGSGWVADQVEALFCLLCRKKGLATKRPGVSFTAFRKGGAGPVQGELFPD